MGRRPAAQAGAGFTLVETVLAMVVLAIVLVPFSALLVTVVKEHARAQAWLTATGLAEARLEELLGSRYAHVQNQTATSFAAPFSAYSAAVLVEAVNASDLNFPVGAETGYRRVAVTVAHPLSGNVTVTSLVSDE